MNYLILLTVAVALLLSGCGGRKTGQTETASQNSTGLTTAAKLPLPDSVDAAVAAIDRRLDIKMKRKVYEPRKDVLITVQKWFEYGDTTRLVKLREEILTGDKRMQVIQYHFLNNRLATIREYEYNKECGSPKKQCMQEAHYFFAVDTLNKATHRQTDGTAEQPPVLEREQLTTFSPTKSDLAAKTARLAQINQKYATLPYPKPRPEKGTPVPRMQ